MSNIAIRSIARQIRDLNVSKVGSTSYYVDGTNGSDSYTGESWAQAFKTIAYAVGIAGSWSKIYIKAGTYNENITMHGIGIHLIGEYRTNTIISGSVTPIKIQGYKCIVEELTLTTAATYGVHIVGAYNTVKNSIVTKTGGGGCICVQAGGDCTIVDDVSIPSCAVGGTSYGIATTADYCEFKNCRISSANLAAGINIGGKYTKIHDNTLDSNAIGIRIVVSADNNTIYHNNFISNTAQISDAGAGNEWLENYYDNHTTDVTHDGIADTAYAEGGSTDYQPVSRRNGWKQESLPVSLSSGTATAANQTTIISGQEGGVNDVNRVAGKTQIFEKSITSAATAGNVLIGTITAQPCLIKSVVVHADTTGQADLTSAGVYGGVNIATHTLTFLSAADAAKANIDVADEQVAWDGAVRLAATRVLAIELLGTGATTVDLTVIVEYKATINGGYLV